MPKGLAARPNIFMWLFGAPRATPTHQIRSLLYRSVVRRRWSGSQRLVVRRVALCQLVCSPLHFVYAGAGLGHAKRGIKQSKSRRTSGVQAACGSWWTCFLPWAATPGRRVHRRDERDHRGGGDGRATKRKRPSFAAGMCVLLGEPQPKITHGSEVAQESGLIVKAGMQMQIAASLAGALWARRD